MRVTQCFRTGPMAFARAAVRGGRWPSCRRLRSGVGVLEHGLTVFVLRSLPEPNGPVAISGCLSSSLPPSIAPGRFATFSYSSACDGH